MQGHLPHQGSLPQRPGLDSSLRSSAAIVPLLFASIFAVLLVVTFNKTRLKKDLSGLYMNLVIFLLQRKRFML